MDHRTDEELAVAAAKGDLKARDAFITRHLGLIKFHCAKCCGYEAEEYLSDAFEYVADRLSKYDGSCKAKTAAFNFLPHRLIRLKRRRVRVIAGPKTSNGRLKDPTRYADQIEQTRMVRSLSLSCGNYGKRDLYSLVVDREDLRDDPLADQRHWLSRVLCMLNANQRAVLLGRASGRTLAEIGLELGITKEWVRKLQIEATEIVKEMAEESFPKRKSA